jgi:hypothetical protein
MTACPGTGRPSCMPETLAAVSDSERMSYAILVGRQRARSKGDGRA